MTHADGADAIGAGGVGHVNALRIPYELDPMFVLTEQKHHMSGTRNHQVRRDANHKSHSH